MNNAQYLKLKCSRILKALKKQAMKKESLIANCQIPEIEQLKIIAMDLTHRHIEPLPNKTWPDCYVPEEKSLSFHIDGDLSGHCVNYDWRE